MILVFSLVTLTGWPGVLLDGSVVMIVLMLICLAALLLTALYLVETLTRPKKPSRFPLIVSPFELDLPVEEVTFPDGKGRHRVSGWYLGSPGAMTTILVCPGYRTRKAQTLAMILFLWKRGFNILAFEFYGHGAAVGTRVTLGHREQDDFFGALAYVRQRAPGTRIGVLAYSMGAAVAILCSVHAPDIEALVLDSAFASHTSAVYYNVRRTLHLPNALPGIWLASGITWLGDHLLGRLAGYRFHQVEPVRQIARLTPRPLLLIHGDQDSMIDPQDAQRLYEAAQAPKDLWMVPKADHCGAYFENRVAYIERVLSFLTAHLGTPQKTQEDVFPFQILGKDDDEIRLLKSAKEIRPA